MPVNMSVCMSAYMFNSAVLVNTFVIMLALQNVLVYGCVSPCVCGDVKIFSKFVDVTTH